MFYSFRHRSISTLASSSTSNTSPAKSSSRSLPLKSSTHPLSQGDPGSIERAFAPTRSSHSRTRLAVDSLPLLLRMWSGTPVQTNRSLSRSRPFQDILAGELPCHVDSKTLPCELVHDHQHPDHPNIRRPVHDEVVTPDVVPMRRLRADACPVSKPQPSPRQLFRRRFQALLSPDPLHPRVVHPPAFGPQKGCHAAVAVPTILAGHPNDPLQELGLVVSDALLPQHPACPTFDKLIAVEHVTYMLDRLTPLCRAQKFPEAASRRIVLSSSASARNRFGRATSFSRSSSRFA